MAEQYVFRMERLTKVFPPAKKILDSIHLSFLPGAKIGIIGINGSGKSTVLKIMAGLDKEYSGEAVPADGLNIGYLPQEPQLDSSKTVAEYLAGALGRVTIALKRFEEIGELLSDPALEEARMMELIEEQGGLQDEIEAANGWELERTIEVASDALRLPPADAVIGKLSGGEKRRVALCGLLLGKPDMLLLDEPTNHLDAESVLWLERYLQNFAGTVVLVTHDRYFLDTVVDWILELDRGRGIPWKGNYSSWLEQKESRLKQEEKNESVRQRTLARELEWIRANPKARQSKSKARINNYEAMLSERGPDKVRNLEIYIPPGPRLGEKVVLAEGLTKAYGDKLLFDDLNFTIPKGAIVGIIGANGAGKTSLFRIIVGKETADDGSLQLGDSVALGYVDQSRDSLNPEKTIWEEVSGGRESIQLGDVEVNSRAYCAKFNFNGADQQKKVGVLSGGERNRVHMAKLLQGGANVLLLDEPSNDLDVETLRALEDALLEFAGCVLVISHDRWFLDRIATHILAFEGDSHVEFFYGNFTEYEADKRKRLGEDAMNPHRIRFRQLAA
jgi:ATP-binding cassette ChvD family protein